MSVLETLIREARSAGAAAFCFCVSRSNNPFDPVEQKLLHDAWNEGWDEIIEAEKDAGED